MENIPTPGSPLPDYWEHWLANPAQDSGSESEKVEVDEVIEVDDSNEAEEQVSEADSDETLGGVTPT